MYLCMHACMYYVRMYVCMHLCMGVCMRMNVCVCFYECMHVYVYTYCSSLRNVYDTGLAKQTGELQVNTEIFFPRKRNIMHSFA
jgi:uncharacterized ion transporter superfamily protein YfcC